jgi:uncharacterized repeat protein (TIGR02543 family)
MMKNKIFKLLLLCLVLAMSVGILAACNEALPVLPQDPPGQFTVKFDGNGGTPAMQTFAVQGYAEAPTNPPQNQGDSQEPVYSAMIDPATIIPYVEPTRAGYTFGGWAETQNGTTAATFPFYNAALVKTFYAIWTEVIDPEIIHTVTFIRDYPVMNYPYPGLNYIDDLIVETVQVPHGAPADRTLFGRTAAAYPNLTPIVGHNPDFPIFAADLFLSGWSTTRDDQANPQAAVFAGEYDGYNPITGEYAIAPMAITADTTFYGFYKQGFAQAVEFFEDSISGVYDYSQGWAPCDIGNAQNVGIPGNPGNILIVADGNPISHAFAQPGIYQYNGNSIQNISVSPSAANYAYWTNTIPAYGNVLPPVFLPTTPITANTNLYAVYTNGRGLKFLWNYGDGTDNDYAGAFDPATPLNFWQLPVGASISEPTSDPVPTIGGLTFGGWTTVRDDISTLVTVWPQYATVGGDTFYAFWGEESEKETVKFLWNYGDGTDNLYAPAYTTASNALVMTVGAGIAEPNPAPVPTVPNLTFIGWTTVRNDPTTLVTWGQTVQVGGNAYFAYWEKDEIPQDEVRVLFRWNYGDGTDNAFLFYTTVQNNNIPEPSPDPVSTLGWTFLGWTTVRDNAATLINWSANPQSANQAGGNIYYALWQKPNSGDTVVEDKGEFTVVSRGSDNDLVKFVQIVDAGTYSLTLAGSNNYEMRLYAFADTALSNPLVTISADGTASVQLSAGWYRVVFTNISNNPTTTNGITLSGAHQGAGA